MNIIPSNAKTKSNFYIVCGVVATIFVGVVIATLVKQGVDKDLSAILALVPTISILVIVFPEPLEIGKKTLMYSVVGMVLGLIYFYFRYRGTGVALYSSSGVAAYFYYMAASVILSPLFEEIVVRKLLFFGMGDKVGFIASGILVSTLFALVHRDIHVFSGLFSLAMCGLAWRGVSTFNRTVLHGSYNLTLAIIMIYSGLLSNI